MGAGIIGTLALIYLGFTVLFVAAAASIVRKAGYSGWWVAAGVVPLVNVVMLFAFAFADWPVLRDLHRAQSAPVGGAGHPGFSHPQAVEVATATGHPGFATQPQAAAAYAAAPQHEPTHAVAPQHQPVHAVAPQPNTEPAYAEPAYAQPHAEPAYAEPAAAEPAYAEPAAAQPAYAEPAAAQPAYAVPAQPAPNPPPPRFPGYGPPNILPGG